MYKCFNLENPLLGIYPNQIVRKHRNVYQNVNSIQKKPRMEMP